MIKKRSSWIELRLKFRPHIQLMSFFLRDFNLLEWRSFFECFLSINKNELTPFLEVEKLLYDPRHDRIPAMDGR